VLDLALQFVGNLCNYFLLKRDKHITILVATSGDTGSAAIHAIRGKSNAQIFVLYPKGRISPFQELQMISVLDENVHVLCVDHSTSDDLDVIVKNLFDDVEFNKKYNLCSINSINWARIMIQTVRFYSNLYQLSIVKVHYYHAYFRTREHLIATKNVANPDEFWPKVFVSVPTGAFGNGCAGIICKMMGLPIDRLIVATNENDILTRFFTTGVFQKGQVVPTVSPSIDIQVPYNFERFLYPLKLFEG
jgi:threonine synthase